MNKMETNKNNNEEITSYTDSEFRLRKELNSLKRGRFSTWKKSLSLSVVKLGIQYDKKVKI